MVDQKPIEVAIVGGGCASIATAFELTRPIHQGKYRVSVYQMGWRLGGKGASGRGSANRIEEHGLHVWLGFYENAFQLLRECYQELDRDPKNCPFADWRDVFFPDSHLGMAHQSNGNWLSWTAFFPPGEGLPGDPILTNNHPFRLANYIARAVALLQTLLFGVETRRPINLSNNEMRNDDAASCETSSTAVLKSIRSLLRVGLLATSTALIEALAILQLALRMVTRLPEGLIFRLVEMIAVAVRRRLETILLQDDDIRYKWEIIDLILAIIVGTFRFNLLTDPTGLDAINQYECREWLRLNGASDRSLDSAFMRALYDLALAYENGDRNRAGLAAGQALRGSLRLFFSYRGAFFWKMRAGMGDVVFAPFYEVLALRGVKFHFFHRLTNVKLSSSGALTPNEHRFVEGLEFDIQAETIGGDPYKPLIEVNGVPCWPSKPDYEQLKNGQELQANEWNFESHWDHRRAGTKTLRVIQDFDLVVLGVGIGEIPHVCKEILATDARWQAMVDNVKTVATQTFQIWLREDLDELGWIGGPVTIAGFEPLFDTWSDMSHVVPAEGWRQRPKSVAYFCSVLPDLMDEKLVADQKYYVAMRREEVRRNAVQFLNYQIKRLWPRAVQCSGQFRWDLLCDPAREGKSNNAEANESVFNSQYWTANVNPTDRHVLALPGTLQYRISPLDYTYDNLTIAGDWTDCGFNEGCVEAAVMSGRLAAHAIAGFPALEDIIGYDHP
jgi:uncharacterized protein with NAD-binding domain and iron-sulfur cluster